MSAAQLPLWRDGWEQEPCPDADDRAHADVHGPRPARRVVGTRLPHTLGQPVRTVTVVGGVL